MDADLYSSTIFVLIHLAPHLKVGDVILFDEYRDLKHEFKALMDFTDAVHYQFKLIGVMGWLPYQYKRIALEITNIPD